MGFNIHNELVTDIYFKISWQMKVIMCSRVLFIPLLCYILFSCSNQQQRQGGWQKVFQNDEQGGVIFGEKIKLLEAVRLGYPVRIGWGGGSVEHIADASFLTIFEGEVFGQIETIMGQAPAIDQDAVKIRFRPESHWTKIAGTNGFSTALMTNYLHDSIVGGNVDRRSATAWYVLYPNSNVSIEPIPLWRKDSPKWNLK